MDVFNFYDNLQIAFLSALVCFILTLASGFVSQLLSSGYSSLNTGRQAEWRCRVTAFVHSIFAVVLTSYAIWVSEGPFVTPYDWLHYENDILRWTESICAGYFIFDVLVMILYWKKEGTDYFGWDGVIHGVMCTATYLTALSQNYGVFVTACHLLFEFSTPMLHIRWFLIRTGYGLTNFASYNDYAFALVFFLCRVVLGPILCYCYVSSAFQLPSLHRCNYILLTDVVVANLLNYYWFYLILRSAMLSSPDEKRRKMEERKKRKQ